MAIFQVQLWPDGQWDGKDYQRVEAMTKKDAAEKMYGRPLSESGSMNQIRAQVHDMVSRGVATVFYDRNA